MSIQIHTETREESGAMSARESKTESGIALRGISLGSLEILRQLANPLSTAEADLSAVDICLPLECLRVHEQRRGAPRALSRCRENKRQRLDKHAGRCLY